MVNNIKLDEVKAHYAPPSQADSKAVVPLAADATKQDSVTVTNNMNKLVDLVKNEKTNALGIPQTLAEIQQQVKSNTYKIDFDLLSEKLINNGILTSVE
jgi:hypothetical protein